MLFFGEKFKQAPRWTPLKMVLLHTHELTAHIYNLHFKSQVHLNNNYMHKIEGGLCETDILHASKPPPPRWERKYWLTYIFCYAEFYLLKTHYKYISACRDTYTTVYLLWLGGGLWQSMDLVLHTTIWGERGKRKTNEQIENEAATISLTSQFMSIFCDSRQNCA